MLRLTKNSLIVFLFLLLLTKTALAQLISSVPIFPQSTDSVIITFNSAEGSGGLANYSGDVYAHTGVITNLSTSNSDWKYVKTSWGQNTPATKLTKIGTNLYQLKISPSIRSFYGVPTSENISKIAFVFRSDVAVGGSYLEGKNTDNSDIFLNVYAAGLNIQISKPVGGFLFSNLGDTIALQVNSINADSVFLFQNNSLLQSQAGNFLADTILVQNSGKFWIKGLAKNSVSQIADSFFYMVHNAPDTLNLPAGVIEGINYIDSQTVILCLFAPKHDFVYLIGDFNNWEPDPTFNMHISPDLNYFWIQIDNLIPNKEYIFQYLVDGNLAIGDPYAEKVSDPWNDSYISAATYPNMLAYPSGKSNGIATVLQTMQTKYQWKYGTYSALEPTELVIYELLIRDFHPSHTFQSVIDSLNYLKKLGINAIELMPVNEFEGNSSWGYNPNFYFAVDKYYGHANNLKKLIDTCHSLGIAVILDVVYNHSFGTSPFVKLWWDLPNNRPSYDNPFFNPIAKHDFNVGFDMNHESLATKKYISRALKFWSSEYKVDGFRFDLSKGFTQKNTLGNSAAMANYDATRIHILESYADSIWSVNPNSYVILEHFADNTEEKELSSRGLMLWGNLNHNYNEAAMGYNTSSKSDFGWISYKNRLWSEPNLVGYMESHDEERAMYKCSLYGNSSDSYDIKEKEIFMKRASLNAAFFLTIPGPKMIWQFGELGYDISIDFNGRTGEKPIRWDYFSDIDRLNNYLIYSALNDLRSMEVSLFQTKDFTLNVNGSTKTIFLSDSSSNAIIIGNFDVVDDIYSLSFPHDGNWFDYFSGESVEVNNGKINLHLKAGQFHIFMDKVQLKPELKIPAQAPSVLIDGQGLLHIFPNPSNSEITFYVNSPNIAQLYFYDINGKIIGSYNISSSGIPQRINFDDLGLYLKTGIYFCKLISGEYIETQKFIIL
jgi:1,4-alpha-glucan branching enzyme